MKILLLLLTGVIYLTTPAWAVSYTCRDSKGTLHFVDNPLRLPESCEGEVRQLEQRNFIDATPSAAEPAASKKPKNNLFQQMIEEDALARKIDQFEQRAADAAGKYAQGVESLNIPKRSRHYGLRARIAKGQKLIRDAQRSKEEILKDLEPLQLSPQKRAGIEKQLDLIP